MGYDDYKVLDWMNEFNLHTQVKGELSRVIERTHVVFGVWRFGVWCLVVGVSVTITVILSLCPLSINTLQTRAFTFGLVHMVGATRNWGH